MCIEKWTDQDLYEHEYNMVYLTDFDKMTKLTGENIKSELNQLGLMFKELISEQEAKYGEVDKKIKQFSQNLINGKYQSFRQAIIEG